jgi:hypothetical protein
MTTIVTKLSKEKYYEQRKAARAMLAALINVMAEADFGEEELAAQCRDAIAAAKAAGIRE